MVSREDAAGVKGLLSFPSDQRFSQEPEVVLVATSESVLVYFEALVEKRAVFSFLCFGELVDQHARKRRLKRRMANSECQDCADMYSRVAYGEHWVELSEHRTTAATANGQTADGHASY